MFINVLFPSNFPFVLGRIILEANIGNRGCNNLSSRTKLRKKDTDEKVDILYGSDYPFGISKLFLFNLHEEFLK